MKKFFLLLLILGAFSFSAKAPSTKAKEKSKTPKEQKKWSSKKLRPDDHGCGDYSNVNKNPCTGRRSLNIPGVNF